jgi:formamidopyrimidine-DNA glycosylase
MPELPEVETVRRQLERAGLAGLRIEAVHVLWPGTIAPRSPASFRRALRGNAIRAFDRYGKWLLFELDSGRTLFAHLRMSGGFSLSDGRWRPGPHDRAALSFEGGRHLHFRDPRKFGRLRVCRERDDVIGALGPDALSVSRAEFDARVRSRQRLLKAALLDQGLVAGLGNIYADEICFAAGVAPLRNTAGLLDRERTALYDAMRSILRRAVRSGGASLGEGPSNFRDLEGQSGGYGLRAAVYGRGGEPCARCATVLRKTVVAQRTTVWCPSCQPTEAAGGAFRP